MNISALFAIILLLAASSLSQDLPDRINGYKVYKANIEVSTSSEKVSRKKALDASIKLLDPQLINIGLSGATIEVRAEVISMEQSGRVDMITFRDVRINGIEVAVEDYSQPFFVRKGEPLKLSKPAYVSVSATNLVKVAYSELLQKHDRISLKGTAFVFGKFKKFGFTFKRVVPVKFDVKISNPLYNSPH